MLCSNTYASILFEDDFDDRSEGECGCTGQPCYDTLTKYDYWYGDSENAPSGGAVKMTTSANNNNKITGATKRGFRIELPDKEPTDLESKARSKDWSGSSGVIYLKWDMYESRTWNNTSYQKLFRIPKDSQKVIPEWYNGYFRICFNIGNWDCVSGVGGMHWNGVLRLGTEVSVGAWHTYILKIDTPNQSAEIWVDGTSYGSKTASGITTSWTYGAFDVGGNQNTSYDNPSAGEYRDYDNIVVGTTWADVEEESDTTAPTTTISTTDPSSTTSDSFSITGTASDAVGVTSVTCSSDRGGTCSCSGTTTFVCTAGLKQGANVITITAKDAAENEGTDTITINATIHYVWPRH